MKEKIIEAKFIPSAKASALPELYALRAKAKAELLEINQHSKKVRRLLAQRAFCLRRKVYSRAAINGTRKERQAIVIKALELDRLSRTIVSNAHKESLATIEAVCLSVFGQSPEFQNQLLSARLAQSFAALANSRLTRVIVAKGSSNQIKRLATNIATIEESEHVLAGRAVLETQSGQIEINIMDDLTEAFSALQNKLQESLS
jgi:hypothetical protein